MIGEQLFTVFFCIAQEQATGFEANKVKYFF